MSGKSPRIIAVLASAVVASTLLQAPASADTDITAWRSQEPCPTNVTCLHYRTWAEGAQITAYVNITEWTAHRFSSHSGTRGTEGNNEDVRNNAASMNNKTNALKRSYYSPNYQGNADWLSGGWAGNLVDTANDNASLGGY